MKKKNGRPFTVYSEDAVRQAASECRTRRDFIRSKPGAARAAGEMGLLDQLFPPRDRQLLQEEQDALEAAREDWTPPTLVATHFYIETKDFESGRTRVIARCRDEHEANATMAQYRGRPNVYMRQENRYARSAA